MIPQDLVFIMANLSGWQEKGNQMKHSGDINKNPVQKNRCKDEVNFLV